MIRSRFLPRVLALCLLPAALWLPACRKAAPPAESPEALLTGIRAADAVAVNPQGAPMVASATAGGGIARVLGRNNTMLLAETSGAPSALAFDAEGDLYVADRRLREVFRVKPWGATELVTENLGSPEGIAVGPDGNVYVTDSAASCVYRVTPGGERTVFAPEVPGARAIVASADGGYLLVSGKDNRIWRLALDGSGRKDIGALAGNGRVSGLALDQDGNLYAAWDGGGRVSVHDPEGRQLREYRLPGPRATALAFGGYEQNALFITEADTRTLYRLRVPQRSQRLLWEAGGKLRITEPADGAIVNRHDGEQSAAGLKIRVKGAAPEGATVQVNGTPATVRNGAFEADVVLRDRETRIAAEAPGGLRHEIAVLWDRASFKRYRFSTDDNIWFLRDIARNASKYKSIFDNPYMAMWRDMHNQYGAKVHHNIYYQTSGFNLSQMPDKFRNEWRANADWIRLSFHARSNDPARPYMHASAEQVRQDYLAVNREIERFAGKEVMTPVTTIHWGAATPAVTAALRKEGVKVLLGVDAFRDDLPHVGYHLSIPQYKSMLGRDYWRDTRNDILFLHHDLVVNTVKPDQVDAALDKIAADPHESEVLELIIHEEYFFDDYRAYEPDFRERVERSIQWAVKHGYKPVFFGEGFLGTK